MSTRITYGNIDLVVDPPAISGVVLVAVIVAFFVHRLFFSFVSSFPNIEGYKSTRERFVNDAFNLVKAGFAKSGKGFRMMSDGGPRIVLAPKYAQEIRNIESMSFLEFLKGEFHGEIDGFHPYMKNNREYEMLLDTVRSKLTQLPENVFETLSFAASEFLEKEWTDNQEWHSFPMQLSISSIITRMSSMIFLGNELGRDPRWVQNAMDYMFHSLPAAAQLRQWPRFLRPLIAQFLPACRLVRADMQKARDLINPVMERRLLIEKKCLEAGQPVPENDDALAWMEKAARAKGVKHDPAQMQLTFAILALHSTAVLLGHTMLDISAKPDIIPVLREEILTTIKEVGWNRLAIPKLTVMDSAFKESQRMNPAGMLTMNRIAMENIQLSDGNRIAKGTSTFIPNTRMWDPAVHPNPDTYDPYRFANMPTSLKLVTTHQDHLGFGLGKHACPGRFFAASMVKIALSHILLKYETKLEDGYVRRTDRHGYFQDPDPNAKLIVRRRPDVTL